MPIPVVASFAELNPHLERRCLDRLDHRVRGHAETIGERLERDFAALQPLAELLAERAYGRDLERLLFAQVANRALAPLSKPALERWVGRKVAIPGLGEVAVHNLYRAMDFLVEHGEGAAAGGVPRARSITGSISASAPMCCFAGSPCCWCGS